MVCCMLVLVGAALAALSGAGHAAGLADVNNCLACLRCGGVWGATADETVQCFAPPAQGGGGGAPSPAGTTVRNSSLLNYGVWSPATCVGGVPAEPGEVACAVLCPIPCDVDGPCGPCMHTRSHTTCADGSAYIYPRNVRAACGAWPGPAAAYSSLVRGLDLPPCDCAPDAPTAARAVNTGNTAAAAAAAGAAHSRLTAPPKPASS